MQKKFFPSKGSFGQLDWSCDIPAWLIWTEGSGFSALCQKICIKFSQKNIFPMDISYGHVEIQKKIGSFLAQIQKDEKKTSENSKTNVLIIKVILWTRNMQFRQPRRILFDRRPTILCSLSEKIAKFFFEKKKHFSSSVSMDT